MTSITLTAEARLYPKDNSDLYQYFGQITPLFNFLIRRTVHHLRRNLNGVKESIYRTKMMTDFNLSNRMAKVIILEAKNHLKLHVASMSYFYKNLFKKRTQLCKKIRICKSRLNSNNLRNKKAVQIRLYWLQMRLNKTNQLIKNGISFRLTFGSKKLLQTNKSKFLCKRDNQYSYIGDKNETLGNQQFQLTYNSNRNCFTYKARYDNNWIVGKTKYFNGAFVLKNKEAKESIRWIINHPKSAPLSYRIIRRNDYLYLQIFYRNEVSFITQDTYGVIGVDFNKGFISVSEIDESGELQSLRRIDYLHKGQSNVTKNSMYNLVAQLIQQSIQTGKDLVIEDLKSLNINKKENKSRSKSYNRMINSLKFGQFKKLLQIKALKEGVTIHIVNPYNTSRIAKQKYCNRMKLNVHDGASYVIARRHFKLD